MKKELLEKLERIDVKVLEALVDMNDVLDMKNSKMDRMRLLGISAISTTMRLPDEFILKYHEYTSFRVAYLYDDITTEMMHLYKDRVNWEVISTKLVKDLSWLEEFKEYWDWKELSDHHYYMMEYMVENFEDKIVWDLVRVRNFPRHLLVKFKDKLNWNGMQGFELRDDITEDLIEELKDYIDFRYIPLRYKFKPSIEFWDKYFTRMDIVWIYEHNNHAGCPESIFEKYKKEIEEAIQKRDEEESIEYSEAGYIETKSN